MTGREALKAEGTLARRGPFPRPSCSPCSSFQHLVRLVGCRQIPASGRPPTPVLTSEDPCCQGHRVAPSSGPCASARGCLPLLRRQKISLCIRRTCLARNSDDKPWPSGRLTHSFHPVPFRAGGGGGVEGSCSCPHVVPGCSLQGGPPSILLDSLAAAPRPQERAYQPALVETSVPALATV